MDFDRARQVDRKRGKEGRREARCVGGSSEAW
jgi:hypothetical protein